MFFLLSVSTRQFIAYRRIHDNHIDLSRWRPLASEGTPLFFGTGECRISVDPNLGMIMLDPNGFVSRVHIFEECFP